MTLAAGIALILAGTWLAVGAVVARYIRWVTSHDTAHLDD